MEKNVFVLASLYGVALKAEHDFLTEKGAPIIDVERFKNRFEIPAETEVGYRKHRHFDIGELIEQAHGFVNHEEQIEMLDNAIAYVEEMRNRALSYKKRARAEELSERRNELEKWKANVKGDLEAGKEEEYTLEELENSGMKKNSRRYFILLAQKLSTEQILEKREDLRDYEVYIPAKEYLELVQIAKVYFAPQLEQAKKTLKNKRNG